MSSGTAGDAETNRSEGMLRLSVVAGVVAAVLAVVWGLLAGSRVIVFDGVSAIIGLVLSVMSLIAARAASRPETPQYPYGRQSLIPLVVGGQGLARLALIIFALTDSVMVIASGGDEASASSAVMYAAVSTALCLALWWALGGARSTDDLVRTELIGWRNATFLSFGILVGFGVVAVLPDGDARDVAVAYVDPVLMLIIGLAILPTPIRLLRTMSRELLEMRPAADVEVPARAAVLETCWAAGLPDPVVRMTKTGGRLYVEVDHVVAPGTWDVADIDVLRRALVESLASERYTVWLNVDLSTDPAWQLS